MTQKTFIETYKIDTELCDKISNGISGYVTYHFNWQSVTVFIDFAELDVNFNLRYWSNYYSCCSGEQFDDLVISRNANGSKDRFDVLRLFTDEKNLSESVLESGFNHYDYGFKDYRCNGRFYTNVYQGRINRETPIQFYFNYQSEILSFIDNDGTQWSLKD